MNEHETEDLLRAALRAKADGVDERSLHRSHPPRPLDLATMRRRRLRRTLPLLAAAAAVIVAAAVGVGVTTLQGDKQAPATQVPTTVDSRQAAPTPATTPSDLTPSKSTSPPPTTTMNTPHTHRVTVVGVTLTVPVSWRPAAVSPGSSTSTTQCLTVDGVARRETTSGGVRQDNCALLIEVFRDSPAGVDPDIPLTPGAHSGNGCLERQSWWKTLEADNATVGGEVGEYRRYAAGCGDAAKEIWSALDHPAVQFSRFTSDASTHDAALQSVAGAHLPEPRGLRMFDRGLVCSAVPAANGQTRIELDRVTEWYTGKDDDPDYHNENVQTYAYDLPPTARITVTGSGLGPGLTPTELREVLAGRTVRGNTPQLVRSGVMEIYSGNGVDVSVSEVISGQKVSGCGRS